MVIRLTCIQIIHTYYVRFPEYKVKHGNESIDFTNRDEEIIFFLFFLLFFLLTFSQKPANSVTYLQNPSFVIFKEIKINKYKQTYTHV